jgi:hypothetical protein
VTLSKWLWFMVCFFILVKPSGYLVSQNTIALTTSCVGKLPASRSMLCYPSILAARTIRSGAIIASSYGSEMPGSSSAIGRTKNGQFRARNLSVAFSSGLVRVNLPNLDVVQFDPESSSGLNIYGFNTTFDLGLFDGLTISPGVRGVFSIDVLGSASMGSFRWNSMYKRAKMGTGSLGIRIGLVRESFTLPGLTFSVFKGKGTILELESEIDDGIDLTVGNESMRFRTTMGKEFSKMGILGGVGWNNSNGLLKGNIPSMTSRFASTFSSKELVDRQFLYFGGLSFTSMIFQLSMELGLIEGFGDVPSLYIRPDPTEWSVFSRIAARIRF